MARRRTERVVVTRVPSLRRELDELIVEEPMRIQMDGASVATTMRTPGHDFELASGFCFTEGLLGASRITGVRYCADGSAVDSGFNVVTVDTSGAPPAKQRLGNVSSSCGWCGSEQLDELCSQLAPFDHLASFDLSMLCSVPARVLHDQGLFDATGAVHAAAAFDQHGAVIVVREDVGRHNAVDKVIGSMLLAGTQIGPNAPSMDALGLFVSGRASIEMVQKAWAAGFSALVAVSAPTALAVEAARRAGMLLAGFMRDDHFNVYAPERLARG